MGFEIRVALIAPMAILLVGCGAAGTPSPTATAEALTTIQPSVEPSALPTVPTIQPSDQPSASPVAPSPSVAATPEPSEATAAASPTPEPPVLLFVRSIAVTLTDDLRMRSQPRVSGDSIKYVPTLPRGTRMSVIDGPMFASGYWWYHVVLINDEDPEHPQTIALNGGIQHGWVAAADHDGTPYIAAGDCGC